MRARPTSKLSKYGLLSQLSIEPKLCTPLLAFHFEIRLKRRRDEKGLCVTKAGRVTIAIIYFEDWCDRLRIDIDISEGDDPFGSRREIEVGHIKTVKSVVLISTFM